MTLQDTHGAGESGEPQSGADTSISKLANRCWQDSGANLEKAATLMRRTIDADPQLFRELMEPLMDSAIQARLGEIMRSSRAGFFRAAAGKDDARGLNALAAQARDYYSFPLSGGLRLGDADHAKLLEDAKANLAQSKTLNTRGLMLKHIAKKVPLGKRVRDVLSSTELKRIFSRFSC